MSVAQRRREVEELMREFEDEGEEGGLGRKSMGMRICSLRGWPCEHNKNWMPEWFCSRSTEIVEIVWH